MEFRLMSERPTEAVNPFTSVALGRAQLVV